MFLVQGRINILCAQRRTPLLAEGPVCSQIEVWEREEKPEFEAKQKMPAHLATNGHLICKSASSYCPTMVALRKLST